MATYALQAYGAGRDAGARGLASGNGPEVMMSESIRQQVILFPARTVLVDNFVRK